MKKIYLSFAFLAASCSFSLAQFTPNQNADLLMGQLSYTLSSANKGQSLCGLSTLSNPNGVAIDPISKKVYIVDAGNNRVLRYSNVNSLAYNMVAEAVFGQTDSVSSSASGNNPGPSKMNLPLSVAVDGSGNLYVADYYNNRVLRFDNASTKSTGAIADIVLGQVSFTTSVDYNHAYGMARPRALAIDVFGNLYVAEEWNQRVTVFLNVASKTTNSNADIVLGQPDFLSNAVGSTINTVKNIYGIAVDQDANLYVADAGNNRVLRFDNAKAKTSGANADAVFGQTTFTSTGSAFLPTGLISPSGIAVDSAYNLYIGSSCAIGIYKNANTASCVVAPNSALGNTSFPAVFFGNTSQNEFKSFNQCAGLTIYHNQLFAADHNNNRVVRFTAQLSTGFNESDKLTANQIVIFPNPFSQNATLHFTSYLRNAHIKVYNMTGKLVKEDDFNGNDLKIERNDLSEGLYLFQVNADNNYQTKGKMIIE